jgi:hypothetical protein
MCIGRYQHRAAHCNDRDFGKSDRQLCCELHQLRERTEGGRAHILVALHESPVGTFRTWRDVRLESAFGGRAEVGFRGGQVS